jgi:hypothetical protein
MHCRHFDHMDEVRKHDTRKLVDELWEKLNQIRKERMQ